jgi:hypothetical protein
MEMNIHSLIGEQRLLFLVSAPFSSRSLSIAKNIQGWAMGNVDFW